MQALVTALGWIGAVSCVAAYALVSRGTWLPSSRRYQLANLVGALLLGTVAARGHVWPSVAANIVWAVIGAQGIATLVRSRRKPAAAAADGAPAGATSTPSRARAAESEALGMRTGTGTVSLAA